MKNRPALKILIPYLAGIILADRFNVNLTFLWIFSAICLLIIFFAYKKRWLSSSSAFLFLCFLIVGFIRYQADMIPPKNLDRVAYQNAGVYGTVLNSQKERNGGSSMLINAEAFPINDPSIRMNGKISIRSWTDDSFPDKYKYGDVIGLYGWITQARNARNPGEFDYRKFLQRQGIFAMMNIDRFPFSVKQRFQMELDKNIISDELQKEFAKKNITLSQNAIISVKKAGNIWQIKDGQQVYDIKKEEDKLNVYEIAQIYDLGLGGQFFMRWVQGIRDRIDLVINEISWNPDIAAVLKGTVLGEDGGMPKDLYDDFRKTSTTHVLVVSGVNFAILAVWVYWLLNLIRKRFLIKKTNILISENEFLIYIPVFIVLVFYAFMTGALTTEFSVIRALIFICLSILAILLNRDSNLFNTLATAALCILIFVPGALWHAGFQLSFVAVASIAYLMPYWEILFKKIKLNAEIRGNKWYLNYLYRILQGFAVSLSAQLGASLISVYNFGSFSIPWATLAKLPISRILLPIAGIPTNLTITLPVFLITPIGFASCLIGIISTPLAKILGWINNVLITLLISGVRWFAEHFNTDKVYIGSFSILKVILIASTIIFLVNLPKIMRKRSIFTLDSEYELYLNLGTIPDIVKYELRNKKITLSENAKLITQIFGKKWMITDNPSNNWYDKRQAYIVKKKNNEIAFYRHNQNLLVYGLALIALFCWGIAFEYDGHVAKITYLDVREADSFLIQSPDNYNVLIDGGSYSQRFDNGERVVAPFLRRNGIGKLNLVVGTHPDNDHIGGLVYILDNFRVDDIITGSYGLISPKYKELLEIIKIHDIPRQDAKPSIIYQNKGMTVEVLSDQYQGITKNSESKMNNNSVVLKVTYKDASFLFTGDIEKSAESQLVGSNRDIKADVLKVPHHGSASSSTYNFINAVQPSVAVVSVGRNFFGHPASSVVRRYKRSKVNIYRTDFDGAITIITDGHYGWIKTMLGDRY